MKNENETIEVKESGDLLSKDPEKSIETYKPETNVVQIPLPTTSSIVTRTTKPPTSKYSAKDFRHILPLLEKRIALCERFVGDPRIIQEGLKGGGKGEEDEDGTTTPKVDPLDSKQIDWLKDIEFSISDKTPLVAQLERIRRLTDQIFHGRPAELEKKLVNLKSWMEAENANASQLLLSYQAKKTFILQNEERLRDTSLLLKQVEELKDYVNPTSFASLSSCRPRIDALERQGFAIAERAKSLYNELEVLSLHYSNAMGTLCSLLCTLTKKNTEASGGATTSTKRVAFE